MHTSNRTTIDLDALCDLFAHRVAAAGDLLRLGLSGEEVADRCRPGGPWQRVLPGVLLLAPTPPTRSQLMQAALRHAGAGAVLTGLDALQLHGMRALPARGPVHVLAARTVDSLPEVRVTRTRRVPDPVLRKGFLTAPLARAAVDAVRALPTRDDVRAVLTEVVRAGGVHVATLRPGLSRSNGLAKQVLAELDDGVRAVPDAWARTVLEKVPLPPPRWSIPLHSAEGRPLGTADAWWDHLALAWQFRPHQGPDLLTATGVVVVRTPPLQLRRTPTDVAQALTRAATQAGARPRPAVTAGRSRLTAAKEAAWTH